MTTPFEDDMAALADIGAGPEEIDELARLGYAPGMFAVYQTVAAEVEQIAGLLVEEPSPFDGLSLPGFMEFPELD